MGEREEKIKILHIQVLPKLSGVQKVSLELFKKLPCNFDKYILFSGSSEYGDVSDCVHAFESTGAKVLFSDSLQREISFTDINAFKEIYQLCKREKFDIVHTNSSKPGIVGRIAATLAGVPLVVHTVHGLSFHKFVKWPKWGFYWACEMFSSLFCDQITIVNRYYTKYFRWCSKKVKVIYNGLPFSDFPKPEETKIKESSHVRILFVGRLDTPKNPMFLLRAAKNICSRYHNVSFTLVGDGEFYDECKDFIVENGLEDRVNLVGWQKDVYSYYKTHHILAIPSIYEAFGLIFVEAGYYSLPTVTTNVEGIPEVVEDGVTGLLCLPTDLQAFEANIEKLLVDDSLRTKLGQNAHNRVVSQFNVDNMSEKYINLYYSGIKSRKK